MFRAGQWEGSGAGESATAAQGRPGWLRQEEHSWQDAGRCEIAQPLLTYRPRFLPPPDGSCHLLPRSPSLEHVAPAASIWPPWPLPALRAKSGVLPLVCGDPGCVTRGAGSCCATCLCRPQLGTDLHAGQQLSITHISNIG